jgi:hypothetical protein
MIDPKVTKLVKEFEKQIKDLNVTWAKLQANDVYVRAEFAGTHSYTEPKSLVVSEIKQSVNYLAGGKS